MGALSLVLLIIYNFSDQLLTNREKRQAKSREAAVRHAKETVQARERWRSAKDVAKKHAAGLQTSLTRTFSRKKSLRTHESSKGGGGPHSTEHGADHPSEESGGKKDNVTDTMRSLEENTGSSNVEAVGEKKKKGKHAHTQSQIFKYAYGQIEKEKAMEHELEQQNNNLTFSGVIAMATDEDLRARPRIEIAFKDLTLTLKGSKKKTIKVCEWEAYAWSGSCRDGPIRCGKDHILECYCR